MVPAHARRAARPRPGSRAAQGNRARRGAAARALGRRIVMRHGLAPGLYRALLRVLPRTLRDQHGDEMHALFLEELEQARRRGFVPALGVWSSAFGDLVRG